ncbi:energy transducer TonB [Dysgonomonas sp. 521]|uniref:energy transducer TonB n=1 Tax=Dysgonomonas sp. 521 TaxID=2302932 RepID=UPI0013D4B23B|nr:energy transducer TonB [Dysgonomonas sp. 521]NDV94156.1 energy transducer TonB [Dysgonomonas sp. 521]
MAQKATVIKLAMLAAVSSLLSCETGQSKEFVPVTGFDIPKLTFPVKDTIPPKPTVKFVPPVIIDDTAYPEETLRPSYPIEPKGPEQKEPYMVVEVMPEFDGGTEAMMKYIRENLKYPQTTDAQGRVVLRFTVTKTGDIEDIRVLRSLATEFDNEAIRVIQSMPKWIPGKQNGVNVDVYYTLPVSFRLM